MKVNVTVELTRDEVLKAVTESILNKHRYSSYNHPLHSGTALHMEQTGKDGGYFVEWGNAPAEAETVHASSTDALESEVRVDEETKLEAASV